MWYGDVVPVAEIGRLTGIVLTFVGIPIVGTFISALAAMLIGSRLKKTRDGRIFYKIYVH